MNINTVQNAILEDIFRTNKKILKNLNNSDCSKIINETIHKIQENNSLNNNDRIELSKVIREELEKYLNSLNKPVNNLPRKYNFDELLHINDLVDLVIENKFDIKELKGNNNPIYFGDEDLDYYNQIEDNLSEFKQIATNLISNNFLLTEINIYNFLKLIIQDIFDNSINYYIKNKKNIHLDENSVKFVYKGGNSLKSLFRKYLTEFPGVISDQIYYNFDNVFTKTDADFQICININLSDNDFNMVHNDMENLTYLLLNRIRNIFLLFTNKFFNFYQLDEEDKIQDINNTLLEMSNKSFSLPQDNPYKDIYLINLRLGKLVSGQKFEEFNNINNENIFQSDSNKIDNNKFISDWRNYLNNPYRQDLMITKDDNGNRGVYTMSKINKINNDNNKLNFDKKISRELFSNSDSSEFYITYNNSIEFISFNKKEFIKFSLLRIKVNFSSLFKKYNKYGIINIPGELIDISIPTKYSQEYQKIYTFNNAIQKYQYVGKFDFLKNNTFFFNSYSIQLFFEDLISTIIKYTKIFWEGTKYEKRINRAYAIIMINLFYNPKLNYKNRKEILKIIRDKINDFNSFDSDSLKNNLQNYLDYYKKTYGNNNNLFINVYIDNINDMLNDSSFKQKLKNDDTFKQNYLKFFKNFDNILLFTNQINESLNNYKQMDNYDNLKDRMSIINQLGGQSTSKYFEKYLVYKNKYLKLKNLNN